MGPFFQRAGAALLIGTGVIVFVAFAQAQQVDPQEQERQCLSNLKQMATGMMMYVQDYDEKFPPMKSAAQVQNRLRPYVKREPAFFCPVTKKPYQPIKALSGKSLATIKEPASIPALFDAVPHPNGREFTAYADGHVKGTKGKPGKVRR